MSGIRGLPRPMGRHAHRMGVNPPKIGKAPSKPKFKIPASKSIAAFADGGGVDPGFYMDAPAAMQDGVPIADLNPAYSSSAQPALGLGLGSSLGQALLGAQPAAPMRGEVTSDMYRSGVLGLPDPGFYGQSGRGTPAPADMLPVAADLDGGNVRIPDYNDPYLNGTNVGPSPGYVTNNPRIYNSGIAPSSQPTGTSGYVPSTLSFTTRTYTSVAEPTASINRRIRQSSCRGSWS